MEVNSHVSSINMNRTDWRNGQESNMWICVRMFLSVYSISMWTGSTSNGSQTTNLRLQVLLLEHEKLCPIEWFKRKEQKNFNCWSDSQRNFFDIKTVWFDDRTKNRNHVRTDAMRSNKIIKKVKKMGWASE